MDAVTFSSKRSGTIVKQPTGYKAFIPAPLPPTPPLGLDGEIMSLLSNAALHLGRLNGLTSIIADPDLFVYLYVRKEALLSSQIEGTQCSLEDVLEEVDGPKDGEDSTKHLRPELEEVSNYVTAMNRGLARLNEIPVSTRLIKEMHAVLMSGVRGSNKTPGEFRITQNWIGSPGANLNTAQFVPPPPHEVAQGMSALEKYIHEDDGMPPLIRAALVHAQFETIHPFLDGNGRLGRLLITFVLCYWGVMEKPLLYLSYFFKANRTEYYSRLTAVRTKGDWEGWVKFFLRGVTETSQMANQAALDIHRVHQRDLEKIRSAGGGPSVAQIFNVLCRFPIATIPELQKAISASNQVTPNRAIQSLIDLGIVRQSGTNQRNRKFVYSEYLSIITRDTTTAIG